MADRTEILDKQPPLYPAKKSDSPGTLSANATLAQSAVGFKIF